MSANLIVAVISLGAAGLAQFGALLMWG
ncbi:MAG: hypothetical protein JWO33_2681, partial [Caulobacteraceae bacterium]|nr:hypothetical protein [Caulobacteraceae bacterium]